MSKKKIGIFILIIAILFAVGAVFENGIKNKEAMINENNKLQVVATSFPQYDFVRAVAKDEANISMLIKPGAEIHSYEPTPEDIQKIQNADLFIYTGGENDKWVEDILDSIDTSKTKLIRLEDCVTLIEEDETVGLEGVATHSHEHEHEEYEHSSGIEYDEHVWTSPKNAVKIVEKVESVLCELDEDKKDTFEKNAEEYISEINDIDSQIRDIVNNSKRKTLVFGDRFPFKYFVEEYGLDYKAAFPGCSDEMEPSADTLSYLINFVKEEDIPVVLYLELSNQKVANTIAEETNTKTMCLNAVQNVGQTDFEKGVTYISLMRENIETLKVALQ